MTSVTMPNIGHTGQAGTDTERVWISPLTLSEGEILKRRGGMWHLPVGRSDIPVVFRN